MSDGAKVVAKRARLGDELLAKISTFRCADRQDAYQLEVEEWICGDLVKWTFDPFAAGDEPQLILTIDDATGELVGVCAYAHAMLQSADGQPVMAEKLQVAAVALPYQGKRDAADRRYSDVVLSTALADIEARMPPLRKVFGLVHVDNEQSLQLLARHDLTRQMHYDDTTLLVTHD